MYFSLNTKIRFKLAARDVFYTGHFSKHCKSKYVKKRIQEDETDELQ